MSSNNRKQMRQNRFCFLNRKKAPLLVPSCHIFPIILIVVNLIYAGTALAVGGISNSKIIVPNTETVEKGHFEVEPFFGLVLIDDADDTVQFDGGVRFTLGVLQNMEAGANFGYLRIDDSDLADRDSNFGDIEVGLKYRFLDEDKNIPFSLAYQGGVTFPTSGDDAPWVFELGGLILTKNFTDEFSMDADFVFALIEDDSIGFVSEIGFGYFLKPWFQPVVELAYFFENPDSEDNLSAITLTGGFTAPVNDVLTIIIGISSDIYTNNVDNVVVLTAAFTFLF
ncbi:MAG TPA: transporter [Thermodesulfobacteriota bacterium]|nr:transporter [Thermodesulfobacteriota bacterium]